MRSAQSIANDDWLKSSWDIFTGGADGRPVLVTNIQQLMRFLDSFYPYKETDLERVEAFSHLPVFQAMPNRLRRQVDLFLASEESNLV